MSKADNIHYAGLRKRPTFQQLVNYLQNDQDIIRYPNRLATQIRNSPYMTQLDSVGVMADMEQQQKRFMQEQAKQNMLREMASEAGQTHKELSASRRTSRPDSSHVFLIFPQKIERL